MERRWRELLTMVAAGIVGISVSVPKVSAFDLSTSSVPREEIVSGGPPKDGIPALTDATNRAVPVVQVYWFAWAAFYPRTDIYEP